MSHKYSYDHTKHNAVADNKQQNGHQERQPEHKWVVEEAAAIREEEIEWVECNQITVYIHIIKEFRRDSLDSAESSIKWKAA